MKKLITPLILGIFIFPTYLFAVEQTNFSDDINQYRTSRDTAKQFERRLEPKQLLTDISYFEAKKNYLQTMVATMILFIRRAQRNAAGKNPSAAIENNSSYQKLDDIIAQLKTAQRDILDSQDLTALKTKVQPLRLIWREIILSVPDNTCVIINERLLILSEELKNNIDDISSQIRHLKKSNKDTTKLEFSQDNIATQLNKINDTIINSKLQCSFGGNLIKFRTQLNNQRNNIQLLDTIASDIEDIAGDIKKFQPPASK